MRFSIKTSQLIVVISLAFFSSISFAQIRVSDDLGREIILNSPARRIVSLAPHNTENLFTAGAGEFIVGSVDHSDFPAAALNIPRMGGYNKINIEAILSTKPDLIIAWSSGTPRAAVQRLIDLGIPVFYSETNTFDKIIANIEAFSILANTQKTAAPRLNQMRNTLATLKAQYAHKTPVRVFYQVWNQPLITLNADHAISRAFEVCGGKNVFSDAPTIAPRINIESVINQNPQLILLAGHNFEQSARWRKMWQKWPAIDAVKNAYIFNVNADIVNRTTQRFFEGTRQICQLIEQARH